MNRLEASIKDCSKRIRQLRIKRLQLKKALSKGK